MSSETCRCLSPMCHIEHQQILILCLQKQHCVCQEMQKKQNQILEAKALLLPRLILFQYRKAKLLPFCCGLQAK